MYRLWLALLLVFFAGCNPEIVKVRGSISAERDINMNVNAQPAPVEIRIYQLSKADKFSSLGYKQIARHDTRLLGDALLKKEQFIVRPGQVLPYNTNMAKETRFIGIVGLFRSTRNLVWKKLYQVSFLRNEGLDIRVTAGGLVLNAMPPSHSEQFEAVRNRE